MAAATNLPKLTNSSATIWKCEIAGDTGVLPWIGQKSLRTAKRTGMSPMVKLSAYRCWEDSFAVSTRRHTADQAFRAKICYIKI